MEAPRRFAGKEIGRDGTNRKTAGIRRSLFEEAFGLVGAARFELATPYTPCRCPTRLGHAPTLVRLYHGGGSQGQGKKCKLRSRKRRPEGSSPVRRDGS